MVTEETNDDFNVGNINVSPQHNLMVKGEQSCRLQPQVMAVLNYLAKNNDRVISNDELLDKVWHGRVVTHSSIQKCINSLRSAFNELDNNAEYVVYFSKRGYQLVIPSMGLGDLVLAPKKYSTSFFAFITFIVITVGYLTFLLNPFKTTNKPPAKKVELPPYTQVKPYVSNTGKEKLIEPHASSERVAFVRNENTMTSVENEESHLFIHDTNGQEWQVSAARGHFIDLAWSPSGRNLVAVDVHKENTLNSDGYSIQDTPNYYTFHIYTFDFKAEKIIEKNLLSHWHGNFSNVSWWDEGTLELTASQGSHFEQKRYRYDIADQNLSIVKASKGGVNVLTSHVNNKKTVTLHALESGNEIQFLDENQKLISKWSIPINVLSMNWMTNGEGVIILSDDNQLSVLYTDGRLRAIDYSPKVAGRIKRVRSINKDHNLVFTVETPLTKDKILAYELERSSNIKNNARLPVERFMENGGGFIYSKPEK